MDFLRDNFWQGLEAILAILGVFIAMFFFIFPESRRKLRESLRKALSRVNSLYVWLQQVNCGIIFISGIIIGILFSFLFLNNFIFNNNLPTATSMDPMALAQISSTGETLTSTIEFTQYRITC